MDSSKVAGRTPTVRSAVSNGSRLLPGIDGRSSSARRYRDLIDAFAAEIDTGAGLTTVETTIVRQAAGVALRAEVLQAAIVNGDDVDLNELTRLSNLVARLMAALKAKRPQRSGGPDLASYIEARASETA